MDLLFARNSYWNECFTAFRPCRINDSQTPHQKGFRNPVVRKTPSSGFQRNEQCYIAISWAISIRQDFDACDRPAVRLACLLDGSRMSREVHVRFCEGPVVESRRPTQQGSWNELRPFVPRALGYRGCSMDCGRGGNWRAFDGVVTHGTEQRADPGRRFEFALLRSAPKGAIPPEASQDSNREDRQSPAKNACIAPFLLHSHPAQAEVPVPRASVSQSRQRCRQKAWRRRRNQLPHWRHPTRCALRAEWRAASFSPATC